MTWSARAGSDGLGRPGRGGRRRIADRQGLWLGRPSAWSVGAVEAVDECGPVSGDGGIGEHGGPFGCREVLLPTFRGVVLLFVIRCVTHPWVTTDPVVTHLSPAVVGVLAGSYSQVARIAPAMSAGPIGTCVARPRCGPVTARIAAVMARETEGGELPGQHGGPACPAEQPGGEGGDPDVAQTHGGLVR